MTALSNPSTLTIYIFKIGRSPTVVVVLMDFGRADGRPCAQRTPGYGIESRSAIGKGIQAEIVKFKSQTACAFEFICKHTVIITCKVIGIRAVDRPYMIFCSSSIVTESLSCTICEILSIISQNLKLSSDHDHAPFRDSLSSVG